MKLEQKLEELNAYKSGYYYKCTCPACGEHEAYIYISDIEKASKIKGYKIPIRCSRLNNCGVTSYIEDLDDLTLSNLPKVEQSDFISSKGVEKTTSLANLNQYLTGFDFDWRGISNETLKSHSVIFYQNGWSDWMSRCGEGAFPKRFTENENYRKRDIALPCLGYDGKVERVLLRSTDKSVFPKELTMLFKQNSVPIWNKQTLRKDNRIIFITEGVPDALSVYEYLDSHPEGKYCDVVALPGVGNWKKLWNEIEKNSCLHKKFVICFDNDEAGEKGYKGLRRCFQDNDVIFQKFYLKDYKDMNEFLENDRDEFMKSVKKVIQEVNYSMKDTMGKPLHLKQDVNCHQLEYENSFMIVPPFSTKEWATDVETKTSSLGSSLDSSPVSTPISSSFHRKFKRAMKW